MPKARHARGCSGGGLSLLIAALSLPLGVGVVDRVPPHPLEVRVSTAPVSAALLAMLPAVAPSPAPSALVTRPSPVPPPRRAPAVARARVSRVVPADVWLRLADCESGLRDREGRVINWSARWHLDSGNGYYGGLQFSATSWHWVGGTGLPHEHSPQEQIRRGLLLQRRIGWARGWPMCAQRLGLG